MASSNLNPGSKSLMIWAYAIGCFDLIAAVLFTVVGLTTISERLSWLIIFAILFGIFWISMIVMLLFGIHGRKPRYVRAWIIFSCVGILAEICTFLYGMMGECSLQEGLVRNGILLVMALIVEFIFLYIIHQFYVIVACCQVCSKPSKPGPCTGNPGNYGSCPGNPGNNRSCTGNPGNNGHYPVKPSNNGSCNFKPIKKEPCSCKPKTVGYAFPNHLTTPPPQSPCSRRDIHHTSLANPMRLSSLPPADRQSLP